MKKSWIFFSLTLVALVGCKSSSKPIASNLPVQSTQSLQVTPGVVSPPPLPKYGWKQFHDETFETHTLQGKAFRIPARYKKLRVKLRADSAVFGGVIRDAVLIAYGIDHRYLRTKDFQRMPCSLMSVDESEVTCEIEVHEKMDYVVRDVRAEGTMAGGLFGVFHHSSKMTERAAMPNKIHISLSNWVCVENCASLF